MHEVLSIKEWKQTVIDNYRAEFMDILEKLHDPVIKNNKPRYDHLYQRGTYLAERIDVLCEGLSFIVHRKVDKTVEGQKP